MRVATDEGGGTAAAMGGDARPVPGVAPAAKQMRQHATDSILIRMGGHETRLFRDRDLGNVAAIGRKAAAAFRYLRLTGLPAWILWDLAHLWFLIGFRNRAVVFLDWAFAYLRYDRSARLITGRHER